VDGIIKLILEYKIDGVILTNTTDKNKDSLLDDKKKESGGLSGKPLKDLSTEFVRRFYKELKGQIPIIGVGGIDSGESAFEKIAPGHPQYNYTPVLFIKDPQLLKILKKS
jgi:dihydroorotate dehydrogenase